MIAKPETQPAQEESWIVRAPRRRGLPSLGLRELWRYREVAFFLALRDVKLRYRQTLLGVAWVLLQPLATVALFSEVFGRLAHVPSDHLPYPVFAYAGMTVWVAVSTGVQAGTLSLVDARELVTKLYFPRLLAPIAAVLPSLVDMFIATLGGGVVILIYGTALSVSLALLPLWVLATVGATLSVAIWLAALNVRYRDVRYILPFAVQLWFFASPITYPSTLFHGFGRYVYSLNPLVGVIDGFRWSLVGDASLSSADLVSLVSGTLLLSGGIFYFRRTESRFADVI